MGAIANHTGNALLTTSPKQRPMIFRWQMVYATFIGTVTNIILTKVIVPIYGGITTETVQAYALIMIGLMVVFEICASIAIAPVDKPENFVGRQEGDNVKPKDMWNLLVKNRALQMYVVAGVSDKIAKQVMQISSVTVLMYGIVIGDYGFSATVGAYSMVPNLIFLFLGTPFDEKERKQAGRGEVVLGMYSHFPGMAWNDGVC